MRRYLLRAAAAMAALALLPALGAAQMNVEGGGMLLYTHAPVLEYDGGSLSGGSISAACDLLFRGRIVARGQVDILNAESLSGDNADAAQSGLALVGSLGYRLSPSRTPRVTIDLLAHVGYAQVTYEAGASELTDASPQFGFGVAPHVALTDRLGLSFQLRYLRGAPVGEGSAINRTDLSLGARLALF